MNGLNEQPDAAQPTDALAHDERDTRQPSDEDVDQPWGRVDMAGTVYARTATGERVIGSWQAGSAEAALAYYQRKYAGLATEVELLEHRIGQAAMAPKDTLAAVDRLRATVASASAVGDLDALLDRLTALVTVVENRQSARKAAKAQARQEARAAKEKLVAEAEQLASSIAWRAAGERLRAMVEDWKSLSRVDRSVDDALWQRFSQARSAFNQRRKAHFAELDAQREQAQARKERLAAEAEGLASSRDWAPTATRFRNLMQKWKTAGRAPKSAEEALWKRFRAAQDTFFQARADVFAERDAEQRKTQDRKEQLLTEAEALLPVTDVKAARRALRSINDRWETIGEAPRGNRTRLEARLNAVERAIRTAEKTEWQRTNPEGRARAETTVTQLRASIAQLEAQAQHARAAGNERAAGEAEAALAARYSWLVEAEKALAEFT